MREEERSLFQQCSLALLIYISLFGSSEGGLPSPSVTQVTLADSTFFSVPERQGDASFTAAARAALHPL